MQVSEEQFNEASAVIENEGLTIEAQMVAVELIYLSDEGGVQ